ncbi:MAG: hypothetical protein OEY38_05905 [Gammaproteobacteria bacterium]|nr:hypothetical protein [Gammaproteobacteria bacterium]
MSSKNIRIYDLVPKPIQTVFLKLGIDERFFRTFVVLTFKPSKFNLEDQIDFSRPLEFVGVSALISSVIGIASALAISSFSKLDLIDVVFKVYFIEWIELYLYTIAFILLEIHLDIIFFGIFSDIRKPDLTYSQRLMGSAFLVGWCYLCYLPVDVAVNVLIDSQLSEIIMVGYTVLVLIYQTRIAKYILNLDVKIYLMFFAILAIVIWYIVLFLWGYDIWLDHKNEIKYWFSQ